MEVEVWYGYTVYALLFAYIYISCSRSFIFKNFKSNHRYCVRINTISLWNKYNCVQHTITTNKSSCSNGCTYILSFCIFFFYFNVCSNISTIESDLCIRPKTLKYFCIVCTILVFNSSSFL